MLTLPDVRCEAPSRRAPDGRCQNLIPKDRREGTRYCSAACRSRAARARSRAPAQASPPEVVLHQIQKLRSQAGLPPLQPHQALCALARAHGAQKALERTQRESPAPATPRIFTGVVDTARLCQGAPALPPLDGRYSFVGVEVVQLEEGRHLVVTVVA